MTTLKTRLAGLLLILGSFIANAQDATFTALLADVEKGCPEVWHDLTVSIDNNLPAGSLFGASPDETDFRARYQVVYGDPDPLTQGEIDAVVGNTDAIALACNAERKALFELMLSTNAADSDAALEAALGVANAIDFSSRQWRVGDIRVTSRATADDGWIFPVGQTIGSDTSAANLKGDDYRDLFEVTKDIAPNNPAASWDNNDTVQLPDMRGRTIYAANNMGGNTPTAPNDPNATDAVRVANAGTLGGLFGRGDYVMTEAQLPTHTHTMNSVGNHNHDSSAMGNHQHTMNTKGNHSHTTQSKGSHKHTTKQALYGPGNYGWGTFGDKWPTGGIRPTTDGGNSATLTNSMYATGNHTHPMNSAGNHTHTIWGSGGHDHSISTAPAHQHTNNSTGSSAPFTTASPGIALNVEIKL